MRISNVDCYYETGTSEFQIRSKRSDQHRNVKARWFVWKIVTQLATPDKFAGSCVTRRSLIATPDAIRGSKSIYKHLVFVFSPALTLLSPSKTHQPWTRIITAAVSLCLVNAKRMTPGRGSDEDDAVPASRRFVDCQQFLLSSWKLRIN